MRPLPVSKYRHDKFSDWSYPVQCCVWLAAVLGPGMLLLGIILLTVAVRDPSSAQAKVYNANVECVCCLPLTAPSTGLTGLLPCAPSPHQVVDTSRRRV
jgi:hypothetical protein